MERDDLDKVSQITRLHKKMREMKAMDDQLTTMKQDFASRLRVVKQGEARFAEKQRHTIDYLTKFKGYIVEAHAKRMRAEKKGTEERQNIDNIDREAEALRKKLSHVAETLRRKKRTLRHHKQYKDYLEKVRNVLCCA